MLRRLIDVTYLRNVCNCLEGRATTPAEANTFLRFLAELLVADDFSFTSDRTGPVFHESMALAAQIVAPQKAAAPLLKHFSHEELPYASVCAAVARSLKDNARFLTLKLSTTPAFAAIEPPFAPGTANPDIELQEVFAGLLRDKPLARPRDLRPATAARYILTYPALAAPLRALLETSPLSPDQLARIVGAAVRAMIYDRIARIRMGHYLPASARAGLLSFHHTEHPKASVLLNSLPSWQDRSADTLLRLIAAILVASQGNPRDMLALALSVRASTASLRPLFRQELPFDACVSRDPYVIATLKAVLRAETFQDPQPSFLESFNPRIFLVGGVPGVLFDPKQFALWLTHRRWRSRVSVIARLILEGEGWDVPAILESFLTRCGVKPSIAAAS